MAPASSLAPAQSISLLTQRLYDADSDIRYMSLNDLKAILDGTTCAFLAHDFSQCAKIVDGFLHTLGDTNGEVQNLTIKCLGSFVLRTDPKILSPLVHKITELTTENSVDNSIPALAVRAVVVALPRPTPFTARTQAVVDGYGAISKVLIPRLVGYTVIPHGDKNRAALPRGLLEGDLEKGSDSHFIDVLTEIAKCFGPMLQADEVQALQDITLQLLESERSGSIMKKKSVVALATLARYFSDPLLSSLISHIIENLRNVHLLSADRKLYVTTLGALARAVPLKFGPYLKTLAPFILSALSQTELDAQTESAAESEEGSVEFDDMREAALAALESFISSCPSDMYRFSDEYIDAALRFLHYDPNIAMFEDEAEDEEEEEANADFDIDEDFEEDEGADDEDDLSWKVRRGAAKTLFTIVSVRSAELLENADKYDRIATALVERLSEREDSVRVEILSTMSVLIRKTGETENHTDAELANGLEKSLKLKSQTKKRRRGDSDASMSDAARSGRYTGSTSPEAYTPPYTGPPAYLAKIEHKVLAGIIKLLKTSTVPSKQASVTVVKDLVVAQGGGLGERLDDVLTAVIDLLDVHGADARSTVTAFVGASGSATATSLQTEALHLISEIAKTHSSSSLLPHTPKLIPAVIKVAHGKSPKLSCDGLATMEQLIKALTPPRSASTGNASSKHLLQLYAVIADLAQSRMADLSVRRQALQVIGTLLGRTYGPNGAKLMPSKERAEALELLYDSARNETARHAAIKAIDVVAALAPSKFEFDPFWFSKVVLELGAQLRKADRALRGSSLKTLQTLTYVQPNICKLDQTTCKQLIDMLLPLLSTEDLHLLGPALLILSALVEHSPENVINDEFNKQICQLLLGNAAGQVLNQLTELTTTIGKRGVGQPVMTMLLRDVGINGSPTVVGKAIGSLLTAGGSSVGVTIDDFLNELKHTTDTRRQSLALSTLGEVGQRSGGNRKLSPDLFMSYFKADSGEVSLAAAVALGRASTGNGNIETYVPAILERVKARPEEQYLALHSIREVLTGHNMLGLGLGPFTNSLWQTAMTASHSEDSRTIGAECVASLTMLDPTKYLPALHVCSLGPNFSGY